MVDGGSNRNDTQAYLKVLTLGSVHAWYQLGISLVSQFAGSVHYFELSNPTITKKQQKYQHYYQEKLINMNILHVKKYYHLIKVE